MNLKKFFLIVYSIVALVALIGTVYLYSHQPQKPTVDSTSVLSDPGSPTEPLYAYAANGTRGPLIDPTKNAQNTSPETGNSLLADTPKYIFEYFEAGRTFNITLLDTNLREARVAAEKDLLQRFSLTEEQACSLQVTVGTLVSISQEYAGKNLGLSFCANRIDLPTAATDAAPAGSSAGIQPDAAL
jgi:hypothetical protein